MDPPALALCVQVHGQGGAGGISPHKNVVHMRTRAKVVQERFTAAQAAEVAPFDQDDARGWDDDEQAEKEVYACCHTCCHACLESTRPCDQVLKTQKQ